MQNSFCPEPPGCPSVNTWIKITWHIHTTEYYLATKKRNHAICYMKRRYLAINLEHAKDRSSWGKRFVRDGLGVKKMFSETQ